MSGLRYALVCPIAYLLAGLLKFVITSIRTHEVTVRQIGLGGFPSTHSAIVSAAAWLIAFEDGIETAAFAVAIGLVLVVGIDALDFRRKLERINAILKAEIPNSCEVASLRDRTGHTPIEVAGGIIVGAIAAAVVKLF